MQGKRPGLNSRNEPNKFLVSNGQGQAYSRFPCGLLGDFSYGTITSIADEYVLSCPLESTAVAA